MKYVKCVGCDRIIGDIIRREFDLFSVNARTEEFGLQWTDHTSMMETEKYVSKYWRLYLDRKDM